MQQRPISTPYSYRQNEHSRADMAPHNKADLKLHKSEDVTQRLFLQTKTQYIHTKYIHLYRYQLAVCLIVSDIQVYGDTEYADRQRHKDTLA